MASLNPIAREVAFKIVFYGPGLGGKSTTLQYIHDATKSEQRGKMVSLATAVDRTLYFDYLPVRLPPIRGMNIRLQLFTVPGQVYYNATRKLVLTGADGVVFVADSQDARADANLESLENLRENLNDQNRSLRDIPHLLQYNKRDLPAILSIEELEREFNTYGAPHTETVATNGIGVFESLEEITRAVVDHYRQSAPISVSNSPSAPGFELGQDSIAAALRAQQTQHDAPPRTVSVVKDNVLEESARSQRFVAPVKVEIVEPHTPSQSEPPGAPPNTTSSNTATISSSTGSASPVAVRTTTANQSAAPFAPTHPHPAPQVFSSANASSLDNEGINSDVITPAVVPLGAFSFAALWPDNERELVREVEQAIASRDSTRACEALDCLATRILASAAGLMGASAAPRDAALAPLLLGLSGPRYLAFRALIHEARTGKPPSETNLLEAYALVLEMRQARGRVKL